MGDQFDFGHVYEGLFLRGLKEHLDDTLKARLKEKGLDLNRPLDPAYPAHIFPACVDVAAQRIYPDLPRERGINAMGRAFFRGYTDTMLGKALMQVLRLLGPRRAFERMQRNFRTGNNYLETKFKLISPLHIELWVNQTSGVSSYYQGLFEEGGDSIGAKNIRVTYRDDPSGGTWYDVMWEQ